MKTYVLFFSILWLFLGSCSIYQSKPSDINVQSKCSAWAKEFFENYPNKNTSSIYTNHFKSKDGSCYILLTQDEKMAFSDKTQTVHRIYNVFENKLKLECIIWSTACMDVTMLWNAIKEYME